MDSNPLRIIEDDLVESVGCDKVDNIENCEQFEFNASENRNSLLIVEDKDLMMDDNNNLHRLSLQVESGDSDSLVMTNEAINRTIIRIRSNGGVDFGELNHSEISNCDTPLEAINHELQLNSNSESEDNSNEDDGNEAIVNVLGQINEIVGSLLSVKVSGNFSLFGDSHLVNFCVCTLSLNILFPSLITLWCLKKKMQVLPFTILNQIFFLKIHSLILNEFYDSSCFLS